MGVGSPHRKGGHGDTHGQPDRLFLVPVHRVHDRGGITVEIRMMPVKAM
ncbi:hypothetical protein SRIMM317S_06320 [Streptomyces rimosus subsp. rimosus]